MKIYACENCSYRSKRLADLQRHKNKKSPCINDIKVNVDKKKVADNVMDTLDEAVNVKDDAVNVKDDADNVMDNLDEAVNVMASPVNVMASPVNVPATASESRTNNKIECSKCFRPFARKYNMKVHEKKCDGTHILQCKICLKLFSTRQSKWEHKKNVKCSPSAITNAITTTNNMNNNTISIDKSTNNNNITNNNYNLIKADFGKECLQKLCSNEKYTQNMIENLDLGRYAIPKTIEQIYFNDEFPENQTLKKERRTDKLVSIQRKGKWETRFFEDICQDLIRKTEAYHQKYFEDLKIKYKDTPKDKKFKQILMPIIIFARMMKKHGINLDLKELGIHLDDEELEEEDYKQILCFRKDMEILMLDEIHEQTVKHPEAIEED